MDLKKNIIVVGGGISIVIPKESRIEVLSQIVKT